MHTGGKPWESLLRATRTALSHFFLCTSKRDLYLALRLHESNLRHPSGSPCPCMIPARTRIASTAAHSFSATLLFPFLYFLGKVSSINFTPNGQNNRKHHKSNKEPSQHCFKLPKEEEIFPRTHAPQGEPQDLENLKSVTDSCENTKRQHTKHTLQPLKTHLALAEPVWS